MLVAYIARSLDVLPCASGHHVPNSRLADTEIVGDGPQRVTGFSTGPNLADDGLCEASVPVAFSPWNALRFNARAVPVSTGERLRVKPRSVSVSASHPLGVSTRSIAVASGDSFRVSPRAVPVAPRNPVRVQPRSVAVSEMGHLPPLPVAIVGIVSGRSEPQMCRVHTRRVVARVQHPESIRDRTVDQSPGYAVCGPDSPVKPRMSVAKPEIAICRPDPARSKLGRMHGDGSVFVDLVPETRLRGTLPSSHRRASSPRFRGQSRSGVQAPARLAVHSTTQWHTGASEQGARC